MEAGVNRQLNAMQDLISSILQGFSHGLHKAALGTGSVVEENAGEEVVEDMRRCNICGDVRAQHLPRTEVMEKYLWRGYID